MELESISSTDRLSSLHNTGLLGSPPDPEFDRLTRIVTKVLRVPVALVSLVDHDHQYFKSCVGLPEPWATDRSTPLSHSFCQHVVDRRSVLAIPDARIDPALKGNLAIHDLGVVAYLGFPLARTDGQIIGALCAIDGCPREWSDSDMDLMSELAGSVVAVIEARQTERDAMHAEQSLREANAEARLQRRLDFILNVMPQLVWTAAPEGNVVYYNQQWFDYTGMTYEQTKDWGWGPVLHPDDLQNCVELWRTAVGSGNPYQGEFRFKRGSDAEYRWHLNRAEPRRDETGSIVEWIGTSTDIHDHKIIELELLSARETLESRVEQRTAELQEQKDFVDAVLENISDGIVACDASGALTLFNRATREMHGSDTQPIPPEDWSQHFALLHTDGVTPLATNEIPLYRALVEEVVSDASIILGERNGSGRRHVVTNGRALFDKAGKKLGAVVAMRDVTATIHAETELQDQKRFVETVLTNVSDGVIACDASGNITYLNPAIQRMMELGDLPSERPREWAVERLALYEPAGHNLVHWEDRPLGKALKGRSVAGEEYVIRPSVGASRNLVISARPMLGIDGSIIGAVATWHDTTNFVQHQKQLVLAKEAAEMHRKGLERFQLLVDGAKDYAIYMLGNDGTVETWNTGASRLKGYLPEEVLGQNFELFYPIEDIADGKPLHNLEIARKVGKYEEDGWRVRKDGSRFWANVVIEAMNDNQGNAIGFSKITRDLTERRKAEQMLANMNDALRAQAIELEQATLAADTANHAKSSFLANMSHEIRTPIAAILGYTDLLLDPKRGRSDRFNDLQAVRRNGKHLLELISDILDLSKIEAGRTEIERIETNLARLAGEVISMTRPKAIEKSLELKLAFLTPVPQKVITDPLRLRQILVNLVGNAVKFTAEGQISVAVSCEVQSDGHTQVRFDVRDSGVGMTPEQKKRLFKPFMQADASTTRQFGGTGLGLTISRQLANLLGGDISVESEAGLGSTFSLVINVEPTTTDQFASGLTEASTASISPVATSDSKIDLTGTRVLLAEDGIDNREILAAYLKFAGARVELAENGREAVTEAFSAVDAGDPYAVIIMDMQMPVLDGYGATSELRIRGYSEPIVALTANAMSDDRTKCLSAGCDFYLSKPVDQREFLQTIARFAGLHATDSDRNAPPSELPSPSIEKQPMKQHTIRSSFADDPVLASVIGSFIGRLPQLTDELNSLLSSGLLDDLRRAAHKLRGAGGSYGLPQLSAAAGQLEDGLQTCASLEMATRDVQELTQLIRTVEGYDVSAEKVKLMLP